jgi:hypothetical protein
VTYTKYFEFSKVQKIKCLERLGPLCTFRELLTYFNLTKNSFLFI